MLIGWVLLDGRRHLLEAERRSDRRSGSRSSRKDQVPSFQLQKRISHAREGPRPGVDRPRCELREPLTSATLLGCVLISSGERLHESRLSRFPASPGRSKCRRHLRRKPLPPRARASKRPKRTVVRQADPGIETPRAESLGPTLLNNCFMPSLAKAYSHKLRGR
jgi:hypothetical protein